MLKPWLTGDYLVRSTICGIPYGQGVILCELPGIRFLRQEMLARLRRECPRLTGYGYSGCKKGPKPAGMWWCGACKLLPCGWI
jgi:hypothetical protein